MALYNIYAGLGGGFGGAQYVGTIEADSNDDAYEVARQYAIEDYESYEGYNGIADRGDIWDNFEDYGLEEDATDEDVEDVYLEEVESWIDCYAIRMEDDTDFDGEIEYL